MSKNRIVFPFWVNCFEWSLFVFPFRVNLRVELVYISILGELTGPIIFTFRAKLFEGSNCVYVQSKCFFLHVTYQHSGKKTFSW